MVEVGVGDKWRMIRPVECEMGGKIDLGGRVRSSQLSGVWEVTAWSAAPPTVPLTFAPVSMQVCKYGSMEVWKSGSMHVCMM